MNSNHPSSKQAIAEASVWLAKLRSEEKDLALQTSFQAWLKEDDVNRDAFETVSDMWETAGGLKVLVNAPERQSINKHRVFAAVAVILAIVGLGAWQYNIAPDFLTETGERRSVVLADGSTLILNTDTKVRLRFSNDQRIVLLDQGEASFEVAKDSLRPFIVQIGRAKVVAVGTVFDVRRTAASFAVTLAEGKVRIIEQGPRGMRSEVELSPGEQFVDGGVKSAVVKRVNLQATRSWRSGQLTFDEIPLSQAVAEMNRYNEREILLPKNAVGQTKVSGGFKAGGSIEFARAVRDLYGFDIIESDESITIMDTDER